jgi:hypothetical protein
MRRAGQANAVDILEARLAQPRGVLDLAVAAPALRSHQHIQCKECRVLWRCFVRFENEIADDDAPLGFHRSVAVFQEVTIRVWPQHVADGRNEDQIESLAEGVCAKIPRARLDSLVEACLLDVALTIGRTSGKSSNST